MDTTQKDDSKATSTFPYWVDQHNVFFRDDSGRSVPVCRYIKVSKIIVSLDRDVEEIELMFLTAYNHTKTVKVRRGDLTQKRYDTLADKGIDISDANYKHVIAYLNLSEAQAPVERFHRKLGWHPEADRPLVYRHHEIRGSSAPSLYEGPFDLQPAGSLDAWTTMVREQVQGRTAMELVLVAGLSAMVVPRLRRVSGYDALFIHLVGNSSIGKTTAEKLAISAFANPQSSGLIKQWTATANALIASFDGNFGIPMAIDESSASNIPNLTSFIYMFSQGHGRERAKSDGSLRAAAKWSFTLLSSGEAGLPRNENVGLDVRLLEIGDRSFTDSAENAVAIQQVTSSNYGYPAIAMVDFLIGLADEQLTEDFEEWKRSLLSNMEQDHYSKRTVGRIALLVQTASYINQALGLELNVEEIAQLLIDLDSQQERDIGERALEILTQYTVSHATRFSDGMPGSLNFNVIGTHKVSSTQEEIVILKDELSRILGEAGFTDTNVVLARWKEKGMLDCESDRYTRKRKLGKSRVPVYVLHITNSEKSQVS